MITYLFLQSRTHSKVLLYPTEREREREREGERKRERGREKERGRERKREMYIHVFCVTAIIMTIK